MSKDSGSGEVFKSIRHAYEVSYSCVLCFDLLCAFGINWWDGRTVSKFRSFQLADKNLFEQCYLLVVFPVGKDAQREQEHLAVKVENPYEFPILHRA